MSAFKILLPFVSLIAPLAARWVEEQEAAILAHGEALATSQMADARQAGVLHFEKVRVQVVAEIPMPASAVLLRLGRWTGLVSPGTCGITLGYGIYLREDCRTDRRLLFHELVHVGQYERFGSIRAFLIPYLKECLDPGYPFGPLEQEAIMRTHEILA